MSRVGGTQTRYVDPAAVESDGGSPQRVLAAPVQCLTLPQHLAARLNAASSAYAVMPCLHAAASPNAHGSGVQLASDATESLNLRNNALTTLVSPTKAEASSSSSSPSVPQSVPLGAFCRLLALDLNNNRLRTLNGIEVLTQLLSLRVAHNELVSLSALWQAPCAARLDVLDVTGNRLESLLPASDVAAVRVASPALRVLYASDNKIAQIDDVATCFAHLQDVRLRRNRLTHVPIALIEASSPQQQRQQPTLRFLDIAENPLHTHAHRALQAHKPEALELVMSSPTPTPRASPLKVVAESATPPRPSASPSVSNSPAAPLSVKKEPPQSCGTSVRSSMQPVSATTTMNTVSAESNEARGTPHPIVAGAPLKRPVSPEEEEEGEQEEESTRCASSVAEDSSQVPSPPPADKKEREELEMEEIAGTGSDGRRVVIQTPRTGTHYTPSAAEPPREAQGEQQSAQPGGAPSPSPSTANSSPDGPPFIAAPNASQAPWTSGGQSLAALQKRLATAVAPATGVESVGENTYVVNVAHAFEAFECNLLRALLPWQSMGASTSANGLPAALQEPAATAAVLSRLPGLGLVFHTEVFDNAPTIVFTDITPACTRTTILQRLFLAHVLRSLKMEEEAARMRLLRARPVTTAPPASAAVSAGAGYGGGGGSSAGPFARQNSQHKGPLGPRSNSDVPDETPHVLAFSNAADGAPVLRVFHVFAADSDAAVGGGLGLSEGDHGAGGPLPYMRWRRDWETATARRKLVVSSHYLVEGAGPRGGGGVHVGNDAAGLTSVPGCAKRLAPCSPVPSTWSLLYTQLVLDAGDGAASAVRKARRARERRRCVDTRSDLARAVDWVLNRHDGDEAGDGLGSLSRDEGIRVAPVERPRRLPACLPAMRRVELDAAVPIAAMHVVTPHWSRALVESYATVRAVPGGTTTTSGSNNNNNNAGGGAAPGFARSVSSMSSGRSLGPRGALASPAPQTPAPTTTTTTTPTTAKLAVAAVPLSARNWIASAEALQSTLEAMVSGVHANVVERASAQVVSCPLTMLDATSIADNRAARNAYWSRCRQQQQQQRAEANDTSDRDAPEDASDAEEIEDTRHGGRNDGEGDGDEEQEDVIAGDGESSDNADVPVTVQSGLAHSETVEENHGVCGSECAIPTSRLLADGDDGQAQESQPTTPPEQVPVEVV